MLNTRVLFLAGISLIAVPVAAVSQTVFWGQADIDAGKTRFSNLLGNSQSDIGPENDDVTSYRVYGRLGADFGAFGLQLDANYSADDGIENEFTSYAGGSYAALHATWQFSPAGTVGLVYGSGRSEAEAEGGTASLTFAALEGSYDFGTVLMTASVGSFDAEDIAFTDAFHDGRYARIGGMSELGGGVVEGSLSYYKGKQDDVSYDMDGYAWAMKYSRQFNSAPVAWSAGLEGGQFSNGTDSDNGSFDTLRVTLGLTTWFGGGWLADAKRRAIFDTPDFSRIVEAGNNVD